MSSRRRIATAGVMNATASYWEGVKTPGVWSRRSNGSAQNERFKSWSHGRAVNQQVLQTQ